MSLIIPVVFFLFLFAEGRGKEKGREKNMYILLSVAAVLASFVAAILAGQDHIGASLSGMISIFMR